MASSKFIDDLQNIVTEYMKSAGFSVGITIGNEENIKITTQFDLKIVSLLLK